LRSFFKIDATPLVNRGSRVYVAWQEARTALARIGQIKIQASTDGGRSFPNPPTVVAGMSRNPDQVPPGAGIVAGDVVTNIAAAVDHSGGARDGNVYIVWNDDRAGNLDVLFTRSPAGPPFAFTPPVRINSALLTVANHQILPAIAVNRAGQIAVVFYSQLNNANDQMRIDVVCSNDGGNTWTPDFTISGAQIINIDNTATARDYISVAAAGSEYIAAWWADAPGDDDVFTRRFICPGGIGIVPPVLPLAPEREDQVIPITSTSISAAAAFESAANGVAP
jgi:hypothetical protein